MRNIFILISWLTIFTAITLITLVGYWYFYPYNPIEFNSVPFKVDNKVVKRGGHITYNLEYCKNNNLIPELTKSFEDGIVYVVPQSLAVEEEGCHSKKIQVYIPRALPPGEYLLRIVYRYHINPLRIIDISVETEKFIVKE